MSEEKHHNDPTVNKAALDMAIRSQYAAPVDTVVSAAIKFRHFMMTGEAVPPPTKEAE